MAHIKIKTYAMNSVQLMSIRTSQNSGVREIVTKNGKDIRNLSHFRRGVVHAFALLGC